MEKIKPWIGSIILLPPVIFLIFNSGKFIFFLDHFNLLIHEGGHGIFKIFGNFIYTLGGTLMQIILPLIFIYYFRSNKKLFGMQLSLVWLGENLMNISVYAADAAERSLPLLGGNKVYHDWHYLLSRTGALSYDNTVGSVFYFSGIVAFIISLAAPLFIHVYQNADIDLNIK